MRGSNVYFFTLEEERRTQDRASVDQQWMHREGTNPTYRSSYGSWISSKMYSYGSCFLWSCFLVKFWWCISMYQKSMMKKRYVSAKKLYVVRMHQRVRRMATASEKWPGHDPIALPKRTKSRQTNIHLGSCTGIGLTSGTAVEETDYRQSPTSPVMQLLS